VQFGTGLLLALAISGAAFAVRSLSLSGAIASVFLGTTIYGLGDWRAAAVLIAFFLTSSILERLLKPLGRRPVGAYEKGGQRDAGQVLGNGLAAAALMVIAYLNPGTSWPWLGFAGSIAAVNADTWATELGVLSSGWPRLITRLWQRVPPGTSGGVSLIGILAAAVGSSVIGVLAGLVAPELLRNLIVPIIAGGFGGALFDSYLGATVQRMYRCAAEQVETEQHPMHRCGSPTIWSRGWPWLGNDQVNFACGVFGALIACLLGLVSGTA